MGIPKVAIVGRPNVGKSSLFNWLAGKRIAIVDPTPGVTRDRLSAPVDVDDRWFEITDTGGIGVVDRDDLSEDVERQIRLAVDEAAVILFVVDGRDGITPLDQLAGEKLRRLTKPVLLLANKCDHADIEAYVAEFIKLGYGEPLCVSAQQSRGKEELMRRILEHLPTDSMPTSESLDAAVKIALVGRRNTGKSTFLNALAEEERTIVSEVEGTTRDSVDVRFERDGKLLVAIDTAGVRYRGKVKDDLDFYSLARSERSIRRADVVLHFLDAMTTISLVDKQLAGYVLENYKPAIFVVNKWDLTEGQIATGEYGEYLRKVFPSLDFVPVAFVTAKTTKNVHSVVNLAQNLFKQASARVTTGDLNRVLRMAVETNPPPMRRNRAGKVYFATQAAIQPPTIVLFTNGPELFDNTYRRYLMKTFRDHLPFNDVAIKMYLRTRGGSRNVDDGETKETPETPVPAPTPKPKAKLTGPTKSSKKKREVGDLWKDV